MTPCLKDESGREIRNCFPACFEPDYSGGLNWSHWDERTSHFLPSVSRRLGNIFGPIPASWFNCWRRGISDVVSSGRIT